MFLDIDMFVYSKKQSPSWEAKRFSASQVIPRMGSSII
jgi:hypothetical protein